jgi:3-oxoacyl-[acyl-carrier protein] reductase
LSEIALERTGVPGLNPFREDLKGSCGIITGAGSGIGRASAVYLARCGARLALSDLSEVPLRKLADEIMSSGGAEPIVLQVNVTLEAQVDRMVAETREAYGRIDFLVTCAGILRRTRFLDIGCDEWDRMLDVNLRGVFLCCRAAAAAMAVQKRGNIVNVASLAGRSSSILGGAHYTTAKHAVVGLSRHMARELGPLGIRVNAFCPGATLTPMGLEATGEEERTRIRSSMPLGRWAQPEEQASVIAFLLSEASSFITGAALDSNGGALMV